VSGAAVHLDAFEDEFGHVQQLILIGKERGYQRQ